jgi:hypothetical protein
MMKNSKQTSVLPISTAGEKRRPGKDGNLEYENLELQKV